MKFRKKPVIDEIDKFMGKVKTLKCKICGCCLFKIYTHKRIHYARCLDCENGSDYIINSHNKCEMRMMNEEKLIWTAEEIMQRADFMDIRDKQFIEVEKVKEMLDSKTLDKLGLVYNDVFLCGYKHALREVLGIKNPKGKPAQLGLTNNALKSVVMQGNECCYGCMWFEEFTQDDDRVSILGCNNPCICEEWCLDKYRPNIRGIYFEEKKPLDINKKEDGFPPNNKLLGIQPTIL